MKLSISAILGNFNIFNIFNVIESKAAKSLEWVGLKPALLDLVRLHSEVHQGYLTLVSDSGRGWSVCHGRGVEIDGNQAGWHAT